MSSSFSAKWSEGPTAPPLSTPAARAHSPSDLLNSIKTRSDCDDGLERRADADSSPTAPSGGIIRHLSRFVRHGRKTP